MENKAVFTNVGRVNFCEQINRRYFTGVTLIDDKPYINMGAEFYAEGMSTWHPDVKKKYFMSLEVFDVLCANWAKVTRQIREKMAAVCMFVYIFDILC